MITHFGLSLAKKEVKMYNRNISPKIVDVIEEYTNKFGLINGNNIDFSKENLEKLVIKLRSVYDSMSYNERRDILIPSSAEVIKNIIFTDDAYDKKYEFCYKWVEREKPDYSGEIMNDKIDRIGSINGNYFCPCNKNIYDVESRSLPYYFSANERADITKCPSYHRYKINSTINEVAKRTAIPMFKQKGGCIEYITRQMTKDYIKQGIIEEEEIYEQN